MSLSIWIVLLIMSSLTAIAGILIGLPDPLRLRGDYLAIVTLSLAKIIPQVVRNGDNVFGFDLTHGTFGISPIDSPGWPGVWTAARLPAVVRAGAVVLLDGAAGAPDHRLLLRAAARLAARARLDRDPRGRDGGCGDGRAADADEDVVVPRSAPSSAASPAPSTRASRRPSRRTSTSTSPSSCSAWSSSAGWARSGACSWVG